MEKTHSKLLYIGAKLLKAHSIENSVLEGELLLAFALGLEREKLPLLFNTKAHYKTIKYFFSLLERRIAGEPIAYLIEGKEFYSHLFYVNHNVLIPRPETELIVQYILDNNKQIVFSSNYLDLCTGSGCIINTLSLELGSNKLIGSDIDIKALKIASKNSKLHNSFFISFFKSSLFDELPKSRYKIITCNPPYIKDADIMSLSASVKYYEPLGALRASEDGLFFYRAIADRLKSFLADGGLFIVEIGIGQRAEVVSIFRHRGFALKEVLLDLAGIERVLIFSKESR